MTKELWRDRWFALDRERPTIESRYTNAGRAWWERHEALYRAWDEWRYELCLEYTGHSWELTFDPARVGIVCEHCGCSYTREYPGFEDLVQGGPWRVNLRPWSKGPDYSGEYDDGLEVTLK
jgi:hypothetical protein